MAPPTIRISQRALSAIESLRESAPPKNTLNGVIEHLLTTVDALPENSAENQQNPPSQTDERDKLDRLGSVRDSSAHKWNEAYEYLKTYKEEHGDVLVPHGYQTRDGYKLGLWVAMQRAKFGSQRDTMQKLYAEFGEQEDKILKAYTSLEKEGLVERKSNTYSISSRSYAQALLNDGKKKGWLFRKTDNGPSADNNSVEATRLIIKKRWFGLGLLVRIRDKKSDVRFCYPHDDLIEELETHAPEIFETTSWRNTGQYHWPNIPSDKGKYAFIRPFLAKYQEVSGE